MRFKLERKVVAGILGNTIGRKASGEDPCVIKEPLISTFCKWVVGVFRNARTIFARALAGMRLRETHRDLKLGFITKAGRK